ncbi:MAG: CFI-box-CTERM domain-containing protein [Candidatus Brocadiia bacterium]
MRFLKAVLLALAVLLPMAFVQTAYAADPYIPSLTLPVNGAVNRAPDSLGFSWTAGSSAPSFYTIQWSLSNTFAELLFGYNTNATSYTVSGLPGMQTIYWRVIAVDSSAGQHISSTFSFKTLPDTEAATGGPQDIITPLTFNDGSSTPTGWTRDSSGRWYVYNYNGNNYLDCYFYGQTNYHFYFYMTTPVTLSLPGATLSYDWAHYNSGSAENLTTEISTDGSNWNILYDHGANSNRTYFGGGSPYEYPSDFKNQTVSLSTYVGQSIYIRFHIYTGTSYPYGAWLFDNIKIYGNTTYVGTNRNLTVSSAKGNPSPLGVITYTYGDQVTAMIPEKYVYPTGIVDERYVQDGYSGSGSVPTTGTSSSITLSMYRTSSLIWQWRHEYRVIVSSPDGMGAPNPSGLGWFQDGRSATFAITQNPVLGIADGTRWVCSGFIGTGNFAPLGQATSVSVVITRASTITWTWKIQYRLRIFNPPGATIGGISPVVGDYWYYADATQDVVSTPFHDTGTGVMYKNLGWTGTGSVVDGEFFSGTITINQPSSLTWQWERQVFLSVVSQYGQQTGSPAGWYPEGSEVALGAQSPYYATDDTRYVIGGWTGTGSIGSGTASDTGTHVITQPSSITWIWLRQYLVTTSTNYGVVNPVSIWGFDGGTVELEAVPPPEDETQQFLFGGWTGTGLPSTPSGTSDMVFNVTSPSVFTAHWVVQFYLTVSAITDGASLQQDYDGWYYEFATVTIVAIPPESDADHRWLPGWNGTGLGSVTYPAVTDTPSTITITVRGAITMESFWMIQYRFRILDPTGAGHAVPSVGDYWYYDGDTVSGYVDYYTGVFYCKGFIGTGSVASSTKPYYTFVITEPSSVSFLWGQPEIIPSDTWTTPRDVTSAVLGRGVALARKSDGSPFIIFQNPVSATLEACYNLDGEWLTQTIEEVGAGEIGMAIVLDRFDVPNVAYFNPERGVLRYATLDSTGWSIVTVDSTEGAGRYVSISLAPDGTVGIAYYVLSTGDLRYASYTPAPGKPETNTFTITDVETDGNVGLYCSLAYTPLYAEPRIAYYSSTDGSLKLATMWRGVDFWDINRISPEGGDYGMNSSLALDPAGRALISYQENTVSRNRQGLIFARELAVGWQVYTLDTQGITGFDAVMKIDTNGYPHVAYNDFGSLYYARFNGESWAITKIVTGDVGFGNAIALDPDNNPAIAYWDGGSLKYVDAKTNHYSGELVNRYTEVPHLPGSDVSGGGGGCFIATAAFGSLTANSVAGLCAARDSAVCASTSGSGLVGLYYAISPKVASAMANHSVRAIVRSLIEGR